MTSTFTSLFQLATSSLVHSKDIFIFKLKAPSGDFYHQVFSAIMVKRILIKINSFNNYLHSRRNYDCNNSSNNNLSMESLFSNLEIGVVVIVVLICVIIEKVDGLYIQNSYQFIATHQSHLSYYKIVYFFPFMLFVETMIVAWILVIPMVSFCMMHILL